MTGFVVEDKIQPIILPASKLPVDDSMAAPVGQKKAIMSDDISKLDMLINDQQIQKIKHLRAYSQGLKRELSMTRKEKNSEVKEKDKLSHRWQVILDLLPGGVIVLDRTGVIADANVAAVELLGKPLCGERWVNIIARSFAPRSDDGHEISLRDGRRVALSTRSMGTDEGQIILLTDQTETRQLQAKVSRNQRLSVIGKMVAALAHQIRTPLSAAMLYAGNICKGDLEPEKVDKFAVKLMSRLNHMEEQIRDMLIFAKGELPLTDRVSVYDLVVDIRQAMEVPIQTCGGQSHWHLPKVSEQKKRVIFCNRQALVGAVTNLVNNGIQSVDGGQVPVIQMTVALVEMNGVPYVHFVVEDNGRGIDEHELACIEEAFYSTKSSGTGLGLYVVQAIAKSHKGKFSMTSVLQKGSRACLALPSITGD